MSKKILFMVTGAGIIGPQKRRTGSLLTELAHPYIAFTQKGYDVDIYSVKGGEAPIDMVELDDPIDKQFLNSDGPAKMKTTGTQGVAERVIAVLEALGSSFAFSFQCLSPGPWGKGFFSHQINRS